MIETSTKEQDRTYSDFIGANWYVVRQVTDPFAYISTPVCTEKAFCSFSAAESYCETLCLVNCIEYQTPSSPIDRVSYRSIDDATNLDLCEISLMSFQEMLKTKTIECFYAKLQEAEKSDAVPENPLVLTLNACTSNGLTSEFEDNVLMDSPEEFIGWVKTIARLNPVYFIQLLINPLVSYPEFLCNYELHCHTVTPFGTISLVLQEKSRPNGHNKSNKGNEVIDEHLPF
jgi:hypothetical protein